MKFINPAILLIIATLSFCSSTQTKEDKAGGEAQTEVPSDKAKALNELKKSYRPYTSLSAGFSMKGTINREEIAYTGTLKSESDSFSILLKDIIFQSPFFSLSVKNGTVIQRDYLRDRTDTTPLNNYRWVEVLGRTFPFTFFLPMLQGYPPEEFFLPTTSYTEKETLSTFSYRSQHFDATGTVREGKIQRIYYKNTQTGEIIIFTFSGDTGKDGRTFPKKIVIQKPNAKDYIVITFSGVRMDLPSGQE